MQRRGRQRSPVSCFPPLLLLWLLSLLSPFLQQEKTLNKRQYNPTFFFDDVAVKLD